jgi:allose kinase
MNLPCVIGMDIGGTNMRIGAVSLDGILLDRRIEPSCGISAGAPETAVRDLAEYIQNYIAGMSLDVRGIAVAFPATLDADRKIVYSASNLGKDAHSRFDGINVARDLQRFFRVPVFIGKDSDFILYNDVNLLGIAGEAGMITGIYFGTGIGSSFILHGETYRGIDGVAGEIGHLPISDNRRMCTCGKSCGCCETVASGWRLQQINEEQFPGEPLSQLFVRHAGHTAVRTFVFDCARVIALTVNLLNSAYTVVGGGVVNMEGFPRELLFEDVLGMLRTPYPKNGFRLLFSPGGQDAGILGAAQLLFRKLDLSSSQEDEKE